MNGERDFGFSIFVQGALRSDENRLFRSCGYFFDPFDERIRHVSDVEHFRKSSVRRKSSFKKRSFLISRTVSEPSEFRRRRGKVYLVVSVAVQIREFNEMHGGDLVVVLPVIRDVAYGFATRFDVDDMKISVSLRYRRQIRFSMRFAERTITKTVILGRIYESRNDGRSRCGEFVDSSAPESVFARSEFSSSYEPPIAVFAKFLRDESFRKHVFSNFF